MGTQQNLANLAQEQSGRLSGLLASPIDWSQQQNYLTNLTNQNLNPQWDRLDEQNRTELTNRGLRPGSSAYDAARNEFMTSRSNAYNSANLNNFTTAQQSQMALRQMPINEILALAGQGQVQQPNFINSPQTGVAGTDVAGLTQNAYNTASQGYNSMMGGLMSAGAGLLAAPSSSVLGGLFALSDRRAKTDINKIGALANGLSLYSFRYFGEGPTVIGLMADEVAEVHPHAVIEGSDGYMRVNYSEAVK